MINLALDTPMTECAGTIDGLVEWTDVDPATGGPRVELRYRTEGRGPVDELVVAERRMEAAPSGAVHFTLDVPAGGPVSFDGVLVSVRWEVRAFVEVPGESSEAAVAPVTVFPAGGLGLWSRLHAAPPSPSPERPTPS